MVSLRLPAKIESLERIRAFVLEWGDICGVPLQRLPELDLVLEELLTNVIYYAYPHEEGEVEVSCFMEDARRFCLTIRDWGRPFNPLACGDPDICAEVEQRQIGGLGIYLVRQIADDLCYQRLDGSNILRISFNLGN